ncbi:MAG: tetratricopeptide repeat protein [Gammaproteobacteria bacterium]|nr:tetratricopeptide repeat protein [Gammaproteobacteria bacterium]
MAHDISDFERQVIARSFEVPVVADFWAAWCGPCKALGPVLEKLAAQNGGAWVLAKIDTERFPEHSTRFGIRNIPAVKLFIDGKPVAQFTGALPESAVREWLEKHLPSKIAQLLAQAAELLAAGALDAARELLDRVLGSEPNNPQARVLLAQIVLHDDPAAARGLLEHIGQSSDHYAMAEAIRTLADQLLLAAAPDDLPEDPIRGDYVAALAALQQREFEAALKGFIGVLRRNRRYHEDGARRTCIALFKVLGEKHPLTQVWRRELSAAIH